MFTGLISDIGEIVDTTRPTNGIVKFKIATNYAYDSIDIGASISCSGACMTVTSKQKTQNKTIFEIDVSTESLNLTTLKNWQIGDKINLERALKMGDELGGHMVSGHVDDVATITNIVKDADSLRFTFKFPNKFALYISPKGSVTLNGTSLTINEVNDNQFGVNIIPHTLKMTTWSEQKIGGKVNLEIDQMARYVVNILENFKVQGKLA